MKRDSRNSTVQPFCSSSIENNNSVKRRGCISRCTCILSCFYFVSRFGNVYGFVGEFLFQIFSQTLYIVDVVTDVYSGTTLIQGIEINKTRFGIGYNENYTINVCEDFINHSHPIWSILNIAFAWIPSFFIYLTTAAIISFLTFLIINLYWI